MTPMLPMLRLAPRLAAVFARFLARPLLAACLCLAAPLALADDLPAPFKELLQASLQEKKSIVLYLEGQTTLAGVVTRIIGDDVVELRNRESARIVVRTGRVMAVAAAN
ncbi:MAG: hypothetical protein REI94_10845 [Moraxellaceae bacterium]|nr:hypothetical protein [Moraxellaceae bacterium]